MTRFTLPLALLALTAAAPAVAQETRQWQPPEGCTGFLTVQQRGCMMSNHYTCEGDAEGDQWRVDFVEQGPVFASRINYETEWVESLGLVSRVRSTLGDDPEDPASLTELLETGVDTYDFTTVTDEGEVTRYRGADMLQGETIEIDGHELEVMTYTTEVEDADGMRTRQEGVNYVSREHRLFLPGTSRTLDVDGEVLNERDNSPMKLITPGEPGFFASSPIYDCGVQDISWGSE
ncbi:hypothetical protein OG2516_10416 [Oceanicola granulosus HTCC2516]|uniref:Uncharacterized protein n=1 Tax=Oceanicola granulosus (strain ATCC BAA-861 / DSM 15982 / KCTC 12143 / HTCC2516) TaxID=314256 RepID=Q2CKC0_OCEGH|nr:hypothetical protein [Oceanicola granulosus]EAR52869.1 hypothetical protein OG2516_10416 [Oceanicola granulosus HTCC2516]